MAQMSMLEGQVQLNCSADLFFEMLTSKQPNIPSMCSNKIPNVQAQQDNWASVGTTRKWDYVLDDGKSEYIVDRIEAIDVNKRMIQRQLIEGDFKKHYPCMKATSYVIPKGDSSCMLELSLEYQKLNENVPEPQHLLDFSLGVFKEVGSHLAKAN